jgi:hypothetical protein
LDLPHNICVITPHFEERYKNTDKTTDSNENGVKSLSGKFELESVDQLDYSEKSGEDLELTISSLLSLLD